MSYFAATRHPWACFLFLLPLLAVYEFGLMRLGPTAPRNGADAWLRWAFETYGIPEMAVPAFVAGLFFLKTCWRWSDRPQGIISILFGMAVECFAWATLLWLAGRNFGLILDRFGIVLDISGPQAAQILIFVGAGIYEEVLFRLVLFSGLVFILRCTLFATPTAVLIGAVIAAGAFAAAHHMGTHGEPVVPVVVAFRFAAGLIFTALYVFRGFAIAVGAHAGYDILVGMVTVPSG